MTSLDFLQVIDAWLSFNNHLSKEQINELRNSIKNHISDQLNISVVQQSEQLVCPNCKLPFTKVEVQVNCSKNDENMEQSKQEKEIYKLAELLMKSENLEASAIILRDFAEKCYQEGAVDAQNDAAEEIREHYVEGGR